MTFSAETYHKKTTVDHHETTVHLWTTASDDSMKQLRALSYPGADVIAIFCSASDPNALQLVKKAYFFLPGFYFLVLVAQRWRSGARKSPSTLPRSRRRVRFCLWWRPEKAPQLCPSPRRRCDFSLVHSELTCELTRLCPHS